MTERFMEKLKCHTPDFTAENIQKIATLFPNCVVETKNAGGKTTKAIDFDQLRQELSTSVVEGPRERYRLDWPGKREALLAANAPIAKTLRPCREESVDFDKTKNLFIEGDNLDALKLLQEAYLGKVKMIYIDPPYNTGNDFIYEDDFVENTESFLRKSNQKDEAGNRLVANTESNGRFHSEWLSMLYSRVKLARALLSDDGVLFISIDDHEMKNLVSICSEIFGADSFVASICVQINPRGRHLDQYVAKTHEYVVMFVRDAAIASAISGLPKSGAMLEEYDRSDAGGRYRLLGLRNRNQAFNPVTRPKLYFPLYVEPSSGRVGLTKDSTYSDEVLPDAPDGTKTCWTWGKDKVSKEAGLLVAERSQGEWRVYRKDYLMTDDGETATTLVKSIWTDAEFNNDYGRKAVKELFGKSVMDFPKSPDLLKRLVSIGSRGDDLVLDFFAGSATTAQAVFQANSDDGCSRRFMMIQLPQHCAPETEAAKEGYATIADLAKERIRRAGAKVKVENATTAPNLDIGFRVLKVDASNMKDVYYAPDAVKQSDLIAHADNIKDDRTPEDLLFQVLVDWGVDLALPITKESIAGKTVFFVDGNALAACFDAAISEELVKELAKRKPLRAVFRDSSYGSDSVKINVEQIFKLLSPTTEIKSL
jgi:adenine-specific DNA-methyltransferase